MKNRTQLRHMIELQRRASCRLVCRLHSSVDVCLSSLRPTAQRPSSPVMFLLRPAPPPPTARSRSWIGSPRLSHTLPQKSLPLPSTASAAVSRHVRESDIIIVLHSHCDFCLFFSLTLSLLLSPPLPDPLISPSLYSLSLSLSLSLSVSLHVFFG